MIYIFLLLIILYWFFKDNNPYTLNMYMGKMGSGKTSHMAYLAQKNIKKGKKVYSNIDMPGCYTYDPNEIRTLTFEPNSVVLLDEIGLVFNNRNFSKLDFGFVEWFKFLRKYKVEFHCYSQALDSDIVVRRLVHNLFIIQRLGKISIIRPVSKNFGLSTDDNGNGNIVDNYKFKSIFSYKFIYLPRYYGLFNSFNPPYRDVIEGTYQSYNEIQEIYKKTTTYIIYQVKMGIKKAVLYFQKKIKKDSL